MKLFLMLKKILLNIKALLIMLKLQKFLMEYKLKLVIGKI